MRRPPPPDDRLIVAWLTGAASRPATRPVPHPEAVAELQALAAGRTDLLAEAAGILWGASTVRCLPEEWPQRERAIGLIIDAGADREAVPRWFTEGQERGREKAHRIGL